MILPMESLAALGVAQTITGPGRTNNVELPPILLPPGFYRIMRA
jgi:hypothetical protein